jgi:2-oxoglutarate ferredoxin oxidoreductase subunit alpha
MVPKAQIKSNNNTFGVIYYGTSSNSAKEADDLLKIKGVELDEMRIKAFPFGKEVEDFVDSHSSIFIIEQNRDAQMKTLLVNELNVDINKFNSILNIDGMPITAQFIVDEVLATINNNESLKVVK